MATGEAPSIPGQEMLVVTTRRGRRVRVRHILPEDDVLLLEFYDRLSPETRRLRFFTTGPNLPDEMVWREAMRLAHIDPTLQAALVATVEEEGLEQAVGVIRLAQDASDPLTAELAIVIRDDYQREGLGRALVWLMIDVARARGLKRLRAVSLGENVGVQRLIQDIGLPVATSIDHGETTQTIDLGT